MKRIIYAMNEEIMSCSGGCPDVISAKGKALLLGLPL